ncbi:hypothetical protein TNCV_3138661 [Trichonephila clavipes]|nr:hypothetical protein TNCV_3138661 [Trichonephila clavipes]
MVGLLIVRICDNEPRLACFKFVTRYRYTACRISRRPTYGLCLSFIGHYSGLTSAYKNQIFTGEFLHISYRASRSIFVSHNISFNMHSSAFLGGQKYRVQTADTNRPVKCATLKLSAICTHNQKWLYSAENAERTSSFVVVDHGREAKCLLDTDYCFRNRFTL